MKWLDGTGGRRSRDDRKHWRGLRVNGRLGADSKARAGMGIDAGDYDCDGRLDLVITNLDFEMHRLNRGLERGLRRFVEVGRTSGPAFLAEKVGRGLAVGDIDNDATSICSSPTTASTPSSCRMTAGIAHMRCSSAEFAGLRRSRRSRRPSTRTGPRATGTT